VARIRTCISFNHEAQAKITRARGESRRSAYQPRSESLAPAASPSCLRPNRAHGRDLNWRRRPLYSTPLIAVHVPSAIDNWMQRMLSMRVSCVRVGSPPKADGAGAQPCQ